jgi:bacillithiol biosynthesis cysteine-adding enzyme BshC
MDDLFTTFYLDYPIAIKNRLIPDYINHSEHLKKFYQHEPEIGSFENAIDRKKKSPVNRNLLIEVLTDQYKNIPDEKRRQADQLISSLADENTFTVTTGHQLCIFTGPLYFIYKIFSTINLAEKLKDKYPSYQFVPVYWMASEDHDIEEINKLHIFSKTLVWEQDYKGAAGHLPTDSLNTFFTELKLLLGDSPNAIRLQEIFKESYFNHKNLAEATRSLVNTLFGKYGLLILDGDDSRLKNEFIPVMQDDLLNHHAFQKVNQTNALLSGEYKIQVVPREINLFYLSENSRDRIIRDDSNNFSINGSDLKFTSEEIISLLEKHPEKFSPNVVLRPLFQEMVLPNLAYIGGPGEISYWLQFKSMFDFYKVPFPVLMLRNSVLLIDSETGKKMTELNINTGEIFHHEDELIHQFIKRNGNEKEIISLENEKAQLSNFYENLKIISGNFDSTLVPFLAGEQQKAVNGILTLEQKLIKANKRKHEDSVSQIKKIKSKLFPEGEPQERYYNFAMFYLKYGEEFFAYLKKELNPLLLKYMVIREKQNYTESS